MYVILEQFYECRSGFKGPKNLSEYNLYNIQFFQEVLSIFIWWAYYENWTRLLWHTVQYIDSCTVEHGNLVLWYDDIQVEQSPDQSGQRFRPTITGTSWGHKQELLTHPVPYGSNYS